MLPKADIVKPSLALQKKEQIRKAFYVYGGRVGLVSQLENYTKSTAQGTTVVGVRGTQQQVPKVT
jgi:UDP-N-acetyl-D-mannosaminuronic acid transferase (WecB/TagA/CpsF family)